MDGYAFCAGNERPLDIVTDVSYPESDRPVLNVGEAIEIATGAPLPERTDTVIKYEDAIVKGRTLKIPAVEQGTYVYERGQT